MWLTAPFTLFSRKRVSMTNALLTGLSAFLGKNITVVFFIYGLSFFFIAMGIVSGMKALRSIRLSEGFSYIFAFCVAHGTVEWMDMYNKYGLLVSGRGLGVGVFHARFYLLAASFFFLLLAGLKLILRTTERDPDTLIPTLALSAVFISGCIYVEFSGLLLTSPAGLESFARYFLGVPATILAGAAFLRLSRKSYQGFLPAGHSRYFFISAFFFFAYGAFSGLIGPASGIFPAQYLNQDVFFASTGVPVQAVRAFAALSIAYVLIRAMAMRISLKLLNTFIIFIAVIFVSVLTGYMNLTAVVSGYGDVVKLTSEQKDFAALYDSYNRLYGFVNGPATPGTEFYAEVLSGYESDFESLLSRITSMPHQDEGEVAAISDIERLYRESFGERGGVVRRASIERLRLLIDRINAMHAKEAADQKGLVAISVRDFNRMIFALIAISLVCSALIWYNFYRFLILPIRGLGREANQITEGDLTHVISTETADELQEFANDFDIMRQKLLERTAVLEARTTELKELSIRDGLTGLFNHRHFYVRLKEELARAQRYGTQVSLLIIDIDDFKHYNDTFGHLRGDEILKDLGRTISDGFRDTDIACRYGGEEFAVIMPETSKQRALESAERMRLRIEGGGAGGGAGPVTAGITVSVGVSSYPEDTTELDSMVGLADTALYSAKGNGKNMVVPAAGAA